MGTRIIKFDRQNIMHTKWKTFLSVIIAVFEKDINYKNKLICDELNKTGHSDRKLIEKQELYNKANNIFTLITKTYMADRIDLLAFIKNKLGYTSLQNSVN